MSTFQYVTVANCATTPSDDANEDGCYPGENCSDNNKNCYSATGQSFQISVTKNCDDYCRGPETRPSYNSDGSLSSYEPVDDQRGSASVHSCNGGDDPYGEQLSDSNTEQGYDNQRCGSGHHFNGTGCQEIPESCGYANGIYACSDSDGNSQECGVTSGNQDSAICQGTGGGGNSDGGSGSDTDNGSGGGSGSDSGNGSDDDSGSGGGSGGGSGSDSGGGSGGGSGADSGGANDGSGNEIPDGHEPVESCDGISQCQCRSTGLGQQQCFAPEAQTCQKGWQWDITFLECMRDDCPIGQYDDPVLGCQPIVCDNGSAPAPAGCPEDQPTPIPDSDGTEGDLPAGGPDKPNDDTTDKPDGNDSGTDNESESDNGQTDQGGPCDPTHTDYLSCMSLDISSDRFDGFDSLDNDVRQARQAYQTKITQITNQFKNKIQIQTHSVNSPFYHDYHDVMGVDIDFGTARLEPLLQYLPALILFMAAVYSAFIILSGYRS